MRRRQFLRTSFVVGTSTIVAGCQAEPRDHTDWFERQIGPLKPNDGFEHKLTPTWDNFLRYDIRYNVVADAPFDVYVFTEDQIDDYREFLNGEDPTNASGGLRRYRDEKANETESGKYEAESAWKGDNTIPVTGHEVLYFVVDYSNYRLEQGAPVQGDDPSLGAVVTLDVNEYGTDNIL